MKRSAALAPLSRDHHVALQEALRLRRATETDIAVAAARFVAFWRRSGARHFQVEEEIVLQALPPGDPEWDATVARVRAEHAEITLRAEALDDVDVDAARALGETLTAHVRFEERVVFPLLERALDDKRLGALGAAVEAAERPRRPARRRRSHPRGDGEPDLQPDGALPRGVGQVDRGRGGGRQGREARRAG